MTQLAISAAIVDSSDDAIICKTLDGRIRTWNLGAERLFGYVADEIIGKSITTLIPPSLEYEEESIIAKLKRGERVEHFETTRLRKDGSVVPVSLTISPVRDAKGNIIAASKIARDISDRKAAEKALEESLRQIAAEATALAKLNQFGSRLWRCRELNAGLNEVLDTVIEVVGSAKGYLQLIDSDNVSRVAVQRGFESLSPELLNVLAMHDESAGKRAMRDGTRISVEDIDNRRDESLKALANAAGYRSVIAAPLIDGSDNRLGAISLHFPEPHVVTQQVLRRLDLYARQACDFILRCRSEDRLRETEVSLREADRRKDEFLAVLAHELRNPLAPIRYALAANKKNDTGPEQQKYLEGVIERQVGNMGRLLDDLLDVSRITRGTLDLRREAVDLATIIEAAVEAARPILDSRKHSLSIELPAQPVRLDADPMRLAQVFSNLLVNAAKYTDNGGQISISSSFDERYITIKVSDNGIGISPDVLPKLFTMFTQSREAIGRSAGGLGVGLALVRGLVQLHAGTVTASSAGLGRGSEFVVRLPMARTGNIFHNTADQGKAGKAVAQRILVVDDSRDVAETCRMLLQLSGHSVEVAFSGEEALHIASTFKPRIVLLDIGMPHMSGYDVATKMRATFGKDIRLVAITGFGQEKDRQQALAAGFDWHLTKPVSEEMLIDLIDSVTASSKSDTDD